MTVEPKLMTADEFGMVDVRLDVEIGGLCEACLGEGSVPCNPTDPDEHEQCEACEGIGNNMLDSVLGHRSDVRSLLAHIAAQDQRIAELESDVMRLRCLLPSEET